MTRLLAKYMRVLCFFGMLVFASGAWATDYEWTGAVSIEWREANNWIDTSTNNANGSFPGENAGDSATIGAGSGTVDTDASINNLLTFVSIASGSHFSGRGGAVLYATTFILDGTCGLNASGSNFGSITGAGTLGINYGATVYCPSISANVDFANGAGTINASTPVLGANSGNLNITGQITGNTGANFIADGHITANNVLNSITGNITLDCGAGKDIDFILGSGSSADSNINTSAATGGNWQIESKASGGTMAFSQSLTSVASLNLYSTDANIDITINPALTGNGGDIYIQSTGNGNIYINAISTAGDITISATTGSINAPATLNISRPNTRQGIISINGNISAGTTTTITNTNGDINITGSVTGGTGATSITTATNPGSISIGAIFCSRSLTISTVEGTIGTGAITLTGASAATIEIIKNGAAADKNITIAGISASGAAGAKDVSINNQKGGVILTNASNTNGQLSISTNDGYVTTNNITGGGNIQIQTYTDYIITGTISASSGLTITSNGDGFISTGAITASGANAATITVQHTGAGAASIDIDSIAHGAGAGTKTVNITNANGDIAVANTIGVNGDLTITSTDDHIQSGAITLEGASTADISITRNGSGNYDITVASITVAGTGIKTVSIENANGDISVSGGISDVNGALTITSSGDGDISTGAITAKGTGDKTIKIEHTYTANAAGITVAGISHGTSTGAKSVEITNANGAITLSGAITVNGTIDISRASTASSEAALTISNSISNAAGALKNITISNYKGAVAVNNTISASGSLTISGTVTAGDAVTTSAAVSGIAGITMTAVGGGINANSSISNTGVGDVSLTSDTSITTATVSASDGDITYSNSGIGAITLNGAVSAAAAGKTIKFSSNGSIQWNAGASLASPNVVIEPYSTGYYIRIGASTYTATGSAPYLDVQTAVINNVAATPASTITIGDTSKTTGIAWGTESAAVSSPHNFALNTSNTGGEVVFLTASGVPLTITGTNKNLTIDAGGNVYQSGSTTNNAVAFSGTGGTLSIAGADNVGFNSTFPNDRLRIQAANFNGAGIGLNEKLFLYNTGDLVITGMPADALTHVYIQTSGNMSTAGGVDIKSGEGLFEADSSISLQNNNEIDKVHIVSVTTGNISYKTNKNMIISALNASGSIIITEAGSRTVTIEEWTWSLVPPQSFSRIITSSNNSPISITANNIILKVAGIPVVETSGTGSGITLTGGNTIVVEDPAASGAELEVKATLSSISITGNIVGQHAGASAESLKLTASGTDQDIDITGSVGGSTQIKNFTAVSSGDFSITGGISVSGNVEITAGGNAGNVISIAGAIITTNGNVVLQGAASTTNNAISFYSIVTNNFGINSGNVTIANAASVTGTDTTTSINTSGSGEGNISITAAGNITLNGSVNAVNSGEGAVTISGNDITFKKDLLTNGSLPSIGNIDITGKIVSFEGDVNATTTAGTGVITINHGANAAGYFAIAGGKSITAKGAFTQSHISGTPTGTNSLGGNITALNVSLDRNSIIPSAASGITITSNDTANMPFIKVYDINTAAAGKPLTLNAWDAGNTRGEVQLYGNIGSASQRMGDVTISGITKIFNNAAPHFIYTNGTTTLNQDCIADASGTSLTLDADSAGAKTQLRGNVGTSLLPFNIFTSKGALEFYDPSSAASYAVYANSIVCNGTVNGSAGGGNLEIALSANSVSLFDNVGDSAAGSALTNQTSIRKLMIPRGTLSNGTSNDLNITTDYLELGDVSNAVTIDTSTSNKNINIKSGRISYGSLSNLPSISAGTGEVHISHYNRSASTLYYGQLDWAVAPFVSAVQPYTNNGYYESRWASISAGKFEIGGASSAIPVNLWNVGLSASLTNLWATSTATVIVTVGNFGEAATPADKDLHLQSDIRVSLLVGTSLYMGTGELFIAKADGTSAARPPLNHEAGTLGTTTNIVSSHANGLSFGDIESVGNAAVSMHLDAGTANITIAGDIKGAGGSDKMNNFTVGDPAAITPLSGAANISFGGNATVGGNVSIEHTGVLTTTDQKTFTADGNFVQSGIPNPSTIANDIGGDISAASIVLNRASSIANATTGITLSTNASGTGNITIEAITGAAKTLTLDAGSTTGSADIVTLNGDLGTSAARLGAVSISGQKLDIGADRAIYSSGNIDIVAKPTGIDAELYELTLSTTNTPAPTVSIDIVSTAKLKTLILDGKLAFSSTNSTNINADVTVTDNSEVSLASNVKQSAVKTLRLGAASTLDITTYDWIIGTGTTPGFDTSAGDLSAAANSTLIIKGTGKTLNVLPEQRLGNLTIDGSAASTTYVTLANILNIQGNMTLSSTNDTSVLLDASASNHRITVGGNWTQSKKNNFNPRQGEVEFVGSASDTSRTVVLSGMTNWYDLIFQRAFSDFASGNISGGIWEVKFSNYNAGISEHALGGSLLLKGESLTNPVYVTRENDTGAPPQTPPDGSGGNFNSISNLWWSLDNTGARSINSGKTLSDDSEFFDVHYNYAKFPVATLILFPASGHLFQPYYTSSGVSRYNVNWKNEDFFFYSFTEDSDGNGKIDRIRAQTYTLTTSSSSFNDIEISVDGYEIDTSKGTRGYAFVDPAREYGGSVVTTMIYIYLKEHDEPDTGAQPSWDIVRNTTLKGAGDVPMAGPGSSAWRETIDTAPPRIAYTLALPGENKIYVRMSEPVLASAISSLSGILNAMFGVSINVISGTPLNVKNLPINDTGGTDNFTDEFLLELSSSVPLNSIINSEPYGWDLLGNLPEYHFGEALPDLYDFTTSTPSHPKFPLSYYYQNPMGNLPSYAPADNTINRNWPPSNWTVFISAGSVVAEVPSKFHVSFNYEKRISDFLIMAPPAPSLGLSDPHLSIWPEAIWDTGVSEQDVAGASIGRATIFDGRERLRPLEMQTNLLKSSTLSSFDLSTVGAFFNWVTQFNGYTIPLMDTINANTVMQNLRSTLGFKLPEMDPKPYNLDKLAYFFSPDNKSYGTTTIYRPSLLPEFLLSPRNDDYPLREFFFMLPPSTAPNSHDGWLYGVRLDTYSTGSYSFPTAWWEHTSSLSPTYTYPSGYTPSHGNIHVYLKPFYFMVRERIFQVANVSIFNNVINPERGELALLSYLLPRPGRVTVNIFSMDGSLVRRLVNKVEASNIRYEVFWDGKNQSGRSLARGIYFIRVVGPDIDETRKVMIIK